MPKNILKMHKSHLIFTPSKALLDKPSPKSSRSFRMAVSKQISIKTSWRMLQTIYVSKDYINFWATSPSAGNKQCYGCLPGLALRWELLAAPSRILHDHINLLHPVWYKTPLPMQFPELMTSMNGLFFLKWISLQNGGLICRSIKAITVRTIGWQILFIVWLMNQI